MDIPKTPESRDSPQDGYVSLKVLPSLAARLTDILRTAGPMLPPTTSAPGQESGTTPDTSLRLLITRALLTDEWEDSVEARLSEASAMFNMPAPWAHALLEAGIEKWFADVWETWDFKSAAELASHLTNPSMAPTNATPGGSPFAPPDLVKATATWLADIEFDHPPTILDFADGTGALTVGLVHALLTSDLYPAQNLIEGLRLVYDDRVRLDIACVVVARAFEKSLPDSPQDILDRIRGVAVCEDASTWALSTEEVFDLVVGTAPLGDRGTGTDAGEQTDDNSGEYLTAVIKTVADGGAGAAIAPSLVVTATTGPMAGVRDRLLDRFKTVEFFNYDLSPEPLLGPGDWMARTVVRMQTAGTGSVTTTPIMRWKPDRRAIVVNDPPRTTLYQPPPLGRHSFVPRIGSDMEKRLVDSVIAHQTNRWNLVEVQRTYGDHRNEEDAFSVGLTADNRFSIALTTPRIYFGKAPAAGARFGVKPVEPGLGDPALAVMLSRTALWWWFATSDGRHVRQEHITEPLSWLRLLSQDELDLGRGISEAWREAAISAKTMDPESAAARDAASRRSRLITEFEQVLLANLGTSASDSREFLSRTSFRSV
jgi:hypothetical protein